MEEKRREVPYSHNLLELAHLLDHAWSANQEEALAELSEFVAPARYSDPAWAESHANADNASRWIAWVDDFFSRLKI